mmetsp:Transcript_45459/g.106230  ORF Transcript_45459/g.106230 Transcript_45459/m.106230 type:complete len:221 (-) Transcript_45459:3232-3894(-)
MPSGIRLQQRQLFSEKQFKTNHQVCLCARNCIGGRSAATGASSRAMSSSSMSACLLNSSGSWISELRLLYRSQPRAVVDTTRNMATIQKKRRGTPTLLTTVPSSMTSSSESNSCSVSLETATSTSVKLYSIMKSLSSDNCSWACACAVPSSSKSTSESSCAKVCALKSSTGTIALPTTERRKWTSASGTMSAEASTKAVSLPSSPSTTFFFMADGGAFKP